MTDKYNQWVMYAGFALTMLVGGLQMFRVRGGFVTSYGGDIAGPLFLYGAMRQGKTVLRYVVPRIPSPKFTALFLFAACATWEVLQLFDLRGTPLAITHGHFDVFDLLAYAITLLACYLGERSIRRRAQARS